MKDEFQLNLSCTVEILQGMRLHRIMYTIDLIELVDLYHRFLASISHAVLLYV